MMTTTERNKAKRDKRFKKTEQRDNSPSARPTSQPMKSSRSTNEEVKKSSDISRSEEAFDEALESEIPFGMPIDEYYDAKRQAAHNKKLDFSNHQDNDKN